MPAPDELNTEVTFSTFPCLEQPFELFRLRRWRLAGCPCADIDYWPVLSRQRLCEWLDRPVSAEYYFIGLINRMNGVQQRASRRLGRLACKHRAPRFIDPEVQRL